MGGRGLGARSPGIPIWWFCALPPGVAGRPPLAAGACPD